MSEKRIHEEYEKLGAIRYVYAFLFSLFQVSTLSLYVCLSCDEHSE